LTGAVEGLKIDQSDISSAGHPKLGIRLDDM